MQACTQKYPPSPKVLKRISQETAVSKNISQENDDRIPEALTETSIETSIDSDSLRTYYNDIQRSKETMTSQFSTIKRLINPSSSPVDWGTLKTFQAFSNDLDYMAITTPGFLENLFETVTDEKTMSFRFLNNPSHSQEFITALKTFALSLLKFAKLLNYPINGLFPKFKLPHNMVGICNATFNILNNLMSMLRP